MYAALLKFDGPELLEASAGDRSARSASASRPGSATRPGSAAGTPSKKKQLPPVENRPQLASAQAQRILQAILPPRTWMDGDGASWRQRVSTAPTTRLDVLDLQEALDRALPEQQARTEGICPLRQDLYREGFGELIRQVTVNLPERGVLLSRCRGEARMNISAYQTLYESSNAFGKLKAMQAEQGKADMQDSIRELEAEKAALQTQVQLLQSKCDFIEKNLEEERHTADTRHQAEVRFLKRSSEQSLQLFKYFRENWHQDRHVGGHSR